VTLPVAGHRRGCCLVAAALATSLAMPARAATPAEHGATIEVWTRGPAPAPPAGLPARDKLQVFAIDSLPLVEARRVDVQYHGAIVYRGIGLDAVIARFAPPAGADLALLHFANGMQVPLPFRDADVMRRLSPFLARGMQIGPGSPMRVARFPNVSRPHSGFADVRPVTFTGNKVVVAEAAHPDVPPAAREALSPWAQADTQSCTFCHGIRGVGASFGWDFVEPTPIYAYRGARNLFHHIKYKPLDASSRGLQMPALSYMNEQEALSVWVWLKAVATHPLAPYAPN
jgi:mono/diheme cytochrome c family protein